MNVKQIGFISKRKLRVAQKIWDNNDDDIGDRTQTAAKQNNFPLVIGPRNHRKKEEDQK